VVAGGAAALPKEKEAVLVPQSQEEPTDASTLSEPAAVAGEPLPAIAEANPVAVALQQPELGAGQLTAVAIEPKGKGQLSSDRVQNPHDPDATYAVKGKGEQKKEHVGYKVQVAESVSEVALAPGEPTRNFITGIVTHLACQSDEAGARKMEQEQAQMGLEKPLVQYVDGAYVSAQLLVQAQAEGREIIGPAPPAPHKDGRFSVEDFQINVEERKAICPAGRTNTQCSRLEEEDGGKVSYRFEFSTQCHDCPLRERCLGKDQRHRTIRVGEHHTALQARRQEQQTEAFKARMKHRNGIEGTQSELVRGHGLRRARSRGLPKVRLQNYFIGAACNVKRWLRREAWKIQQALRATVPQETAAAVS
jgi:transposase